MSAPLGSMSGAELWFHLRAAASGLRSGPAGAIAGLATAGGQPRLGWVVPPPWSVVERTISGPAAALGGVRPAILLGTGGWIWGANAAAEAAGGGPAAFLAVDSLDPAVIGAALDAGADGPCVAISGSGATFETRLLVDTVAAARPGAGAPSLWLSDEARGRVPWCPLSLRGAPDTVALFGAPLSTAFLLPALLLLGCELRPVYEELLASWEEIGMRAAEQAAAIPLRRRGHVQLGLPEAAGSGLRSWLLQLGRQVLCSKAPWFQPRVDVAPGAVCAGEVAATLGHPLARVMAWQYAASVLVGCLGLRAGLRVAEHRAVDEYKALLGQPDGGPQAVVHGDDELLDRMAGWLAARPDLAGAHVVAYDDTLATRAAGWAAALEARTQRRCEGHEGSAWNHHSYQAVHGDHETGVVVVSGPAAGPSGTGGGALERQALGLRSIASATHASLAARGLRLELVGCR